MNVLTKLWRALFNKIEYRVYANGLMVYSGKSRKDAMGTYNKHSHFVRISPEGGKVALMKRTESFRRKTVLLERTIQRARQTHDKRDIPFTRWFQETG